MIVHAIRHVLDVCTVILLTICLGYQKVRSALIIQSLGSAAPPAADIWIHKIYVIDQLRSTRELYLPAVVVIEAQND